MKKVIALSCQLLIFLSCQLHAQNVGIGTTTPHAAAALDITSTNKGLLIPRMTTTSRTTIASPAKGLIVFDSITNSMWMYTTQWKELSTGSTTDNDFVFQQNTLPSYNMGTAVTSSDSSCYIYDSGGPSGNYNNNENINFTLSFPANSQLCKIQIVSLATEFPYDSLRIYQGSETYTFAENATNQTIYFTSTGVVSLNFRSNAVNTNAGYQIRVDHYFLPTTTTNLSSILTGFYYIPEKVAIRGGLQTDNNWYKDSVGLYSISYGYGTKAKGNNSVAFGNNTAATNNHSIAIGNFANASGEKAMALGEYTIASGFTSTAMGNATVASGQKSTALGDGSKASGQYSTAMGVGTLAGGDFSTSMGYNTSAGGNYSTAMGLDASAGGNYSTAMGYSTSAGGDNSTAMGLGASAGGDNSTAMGRYTSARGNSSTAMGYSTSAGGLSSTAMGSNTTAKGYASTVIGVYNDTANAANATYFNSANRLFQIGNGTDNNARSNALTVLQNGNVGIGILVPTEKLDVTGNAKVSGNVTVQNGKGLIRNTNGIQSKKLSSSVVVNASFAAGETKTFSITWPEAFSGTPEAYVGNIVSGSGGWAEVVMTVFGVTSTGATLYVYNPKTVSANPNFTIKIIAIGPQ